MPEYAYHHAKIRTHKIRTAGGWGIAAFVMALAIMFGPYAMICGALGWGKYRKNRALAIMGFVVGLIETIVFIALFIDIISHPGPH